MSRAPFPRVFIGGDKHDISLCDVFTQQNINNLNDTFYTSICRATEIFINQLLLLLLLLLFVVVGVNLRSLHSQSIDLQKIILNPSTR